MIVGQEIVGVPGCDHWHPQAICQREDPVVLAGETDSGARIDHRPGGLSKPGNDILNLPGNVARAKGRKVFLRIVRFESGRIDRRCLHINGQIEPYGPWPSKGRQMQRPFKVVSNAGGIVDQCGIFRDAADHGNDIRFLIAQLPQR